MKKLVIALLVLMLLGAGYVAGERYVTTGYVEMLGRCRLDNANSAERAARSELRDTLHRHPERGTVSDYVMHKVTITRMDDSTRAVVYFVVPDTNLAATVSLSSNGCTGQVSFGGG